MVPLCLCVCFLLYFAQCLLGAAPAGQTQYSTLSRVYQQRLAPPLSHTPLSCADPSSHLKYNSYKIFSVFDVLCLSKLGVFKHGDCTLPSLVACMTSLSLSNQWAISIWLLMSCFSTYSARIQPGRIQNPKSYQVQQRVE